MAGSCPLTHVSFLLPHIFTHLILLIPGGAYPAGLQRSLEGRDRGHAQGGGQALCPCSLREGRLAGAGGSGASMGVKRRFPQPFQDMFVLATLVYYTSFNDATSSFFASSSPHPSLSLPWLPTGLHDLPPQVLHPNAGADQAARARRPNPRQGRRQHPLHHVRDQTDHQDLIGHLDLDLDPGASYLRLRCRDDSGS